MGLLDFQHSEEELAFPNFDAGFSSSPSTPTARDSSYFFKHSPKASITDLASRTVPPTPKSPSQSSQSSKSSLSLKRRDARKPTHRTSSSTSSARIPPPPSPQRRPRRNTFDLWGEDEALQEAVPRIMFCDVCLRHCDIH